MNLKELQYNCINLILHDLDRYTNVPCYIDTKIPIYEFDKQKISIDQFITEIVQQVSKSQNLECNYNIRIVRKYMDNTKTLVLMIIKDIII